MSFNSLGEYFYSRSIFVKIDQLLSDVVFIGGIVSKFDRAMKENDFVTVMSLWKSSPNELELTADSLNIAILFGWSPLIRWLLDRELKPDDNSLLCAYFSTVSLNLIEKLKQLGASAENTLAHSEHSYYAWKKSNRLCRGARIIEVFTYANKNLSQLSNRYGPFNGLKVKMNYYHYSRKELPLSIPDSHTVFSLFATEMHRDNFQEVVSHDLIYEHEFIRWLNEHPHFIVARGDLGFYIDDEMHICESPNLTWKQLTIDLNVKILKKFVHNLFLGTREDLDELVNFPNLYFVFKLILSGIKPKAELLANILNSQIPEKYVDQLLLASTRKDEQSLAMLNHPPDPAAQLYGLKLESLIKYNHLGLNLNDMIQYTFHCYISKIIEIRLTPIWEKSKPITPEDYTNLMLSAFEHVDEQGMEEAKKYITPCYSYIVSRLELSGLLLNRYTLSNALSIQIPEAGINRLLKEGAQSDIRSLFLAIRYVTPDCFIKILKSWYIKYHHLPQIPDDLNTSNSIFNFFKDKNNVNAIEKLPLELQEDLKSIVYVKNNPY